MPRKTKAAALAAQVLAQGPVQAYNWLLVAKPASYQWPKYMQQAVAMVANSPAVIIGQRMVANHLLVQAMGKQASMAGKAHTANPYPCRSPNYIAWQEGWLIQEGIIYA